MKSTRHKGGSLSKGAALPFSFLPQWGQFLQERVFFLLEKFFPLIVDPLSDRSFIHGSEQEIILCKTGE